VVHREHNVTPSKVELHSSRSSHDIGLLSEPSTAYTDLKQPGFTIICGASDVMKAMLPARPAGCACTTRPWRRSESFKLRVPDLRVPRGTIIQKLYFLQPYCTRRFTGSTGDWVTSISHGDTFFILKLGHGGLEAQNPGLNGKSNDHCRSPLIHGKLNHGELRMFTMS
jgi:hypothetical protein